MTPLAGYAPDADPATPGIITDCTNMVPTLRGLAGAPSQVAPLGVGPLAAAARGAGTMVTTDGARRIIAGTQTALYELSGSTWVDRSRVGGYTGTAESRWSIAQFGNATLATNDAEPLQASTGAGFADIAGAPRARMLVTAANFVLAFNTVDGTYGDHGDRWWCSAIYDHTSWTPSITTQATTGRLVGDGGEITAARRLGQQVVAYKSRSMFLGSYVGAPVVWQWDQVPGDVGCVGPEAVADVGGAHVFVGEDNLWFYDGTRPVPFADGVMRDWFFANSSQLYRYRTILQFDRQNGRVWFFFPSRESSTGQPDRCIVYHLARKAWGRADQVAQCSLNYVSNGATFDTMPGTFDAQPDLSMDSQYWLPGGRAPAIFNSSNQLVTLTGAAGASSITTGDIGDDDAATMLRRARLRFITEPTSASAEGFTRPGEGRPLTRASNSVLQDSGFDMRQSARWHRIRFDFTGDVEVSAARYDLVPAGAR